jgi:hypothetical protein
MLEKQENEHRAIERLFEEQDAMLRAKISEAKRAAADAADADPSGSEWHQQFAARQEERKRALMAYLGENAVP